MDHWITNKKWPIEIRMVTWVMTSRDPEGSRSWPRYIWGQLSPKRLEIQTWFQWTTYRKCLPGNQMVTSDDVTWPWKVQVVTTNMLKVQYLENGWRYRLGSNGPPTAKWLIEIRMITWLMTSRDHERSRLWHLVTLKVNVVTRIWYQFV